MKKKMIKLGVWVYYIPETDVRVADVSFIRGSLRYITDPISPISPMSPMSPINPINPVSEHHTKTLYFVRRTDTLESRHLKCLFCHI